MTAYHRGIMITATGALVMTSDTLLLKIIGHSGLTVAFWRGALMFVMFMLIWTVLRIIGQPIPLIGGRAGWLAAALFGGASILFVTSLAATAASNTLFLLATTPFWSALLSRIFLGERPAREVWVAMIAALLGVAVIVSTGLSSGHGVGDLLGLGAAVCMGSAFVVTRQSDAVLFMAPGIGGVLSAIVLIPWLPYLSLPAIAAAPMAVEGLLVMPAALGCLALGPRYLPAPQVALFLLLETTLGPVWVWAFLGEQPSSEVLVGGAFVVAAIVVQNVVSIRRANSAQRLARTPG